MFNKLLKISFLCFLALLTNHSAYSTNTGYDATNFSFGIGSGSQNAAFGTNALNQIITGVGNSAYGYMSLGKTNGIGNTAVGSWALFDSNSGDYNNALGRRALLANISGSSNMAMGYQSLTSNTNGSNNVVMGHQSGYSNENGSWNIFLGYQSGYSETGSNKLYIDNSNTSSPLIHGDFDTDKITINGAMTITGNVAASKLTNTSGNTVLNTNSGNVFLGTQAGGSETGSNKLYIDNSNTSSPLIYGDFDTNKLTINGDMSVTGSLTANTIVDTSGNTIIRTDSSTGAIHIGANSMVFYDATSATGNGSDIMSSSVGKIQIGLNDTDTTTFKGNVHVPDPTASTHAASKRYVDSIGAVSMAMNSALTPRGDGTYFGIGTSVVDGQGAISSSLSFIEDKRLLNVVVGYNNLVDTPTLSGGVSWKF